MKLLPALSCLCWSLALSSAAPTHHEDTLISDPPHPDYDAIPDRCDGVEFDAITPDEKGNTFFFKGEYLWKGFSGDAQLANETFKELDEYHHIGHVDAAFRMHNRDNPGDHDHIYFFLDDKVFSYYDHVLEEGYPKQIQEDFPGVPSHLDAAVECPVGECPADFVLFFKGSDVHTYDITTRTVKKKTWTHMPNCTSAFRWLQNYYCFHGHNFFRFHPITGEVGEGYPKESRRYFMRCPGFEHGQGGRHQVANCSETSLDAITTDHMGRSYSFKGPMYMRLDEHRDGSHPFRISRLWPQVASGVDAAFSYADKLYLIKGFQVYIYKTTAHYTLIAGYPKTLQEELGVVGPVDAAFVCPDDHNLYITQGQKMVEIDLTATPRTICTERLLPFSIDAGRCGPVGVLHVFKGSKFYDYGSPMVFASSRMIPEPQNINSKMAGCRD